MTIPGVVRKSGVVASAANIDKSWIGTDADDLLSDELGREVHVINDADAAGLAEARYGVATRPRRPGHRHHARHRHRLGAAVRRRAGAQHRARPPRDRGHDAESRAANSARKDEDLSWEKWAKRLTTYYRTLEKLFSPDLFVVGGGVSKHGASSSR